MIGKFLMKNVPYIISGTAMVFCILTQSWFGACINAAALVFIGLMGNISGKRLERIKAEHEKFIKYMDDTVQKMKLLEEQKQQIEEQIELIKNLKKGMYIQFENEDGDKFTGCIDGFERDNCLVICGGEIEPVPYHRIGGTEPFRVGWNQEI